MRLSNMSRRRLLAGSLAAPFAALMPRQSWTANAVDVVVVGAGLSGLYAASVLEAAGLNVTVIEGRQRVGGRVCTLDDVPGHPEAGGQTIGPKYGRVRFVAQRHGLKLNTGYYETGMEGLEQLLHIRGRRYTLGQWKNAPENPFADAYKGVHPDLLFWRLLGDSPFADLDQWLAPNSQIIDRPVAAHFRQLGLSDEAIDLLGVNNNYGWTLDETSLLYMHRVQTILGQSMGMPGGAATIAGGNSRLPEAMAASVRGPVVRGKVVTRIDHSGPLAEISCADGSSYRGRYVIVSVPLPALKRIAFVPALPTKHLEAAAAVPYGPVVQAHFSVQKPFWTAHGFAPALWTDSPIERIFAADPAGTGEISNLVAFVNGKGTERLSALRGRQKDEFFIEGMSRVLPESKGSIRFERTFSWQESELSGGSFAVWAPGQVARYAAAVAQPTGPIHFAGEHTARWMSGMEGAMESGERAASEVLDRVAA
ncbi:MAG: FAD-dependent oxidoreductase [Gammaproteobacteria bacterium]|nr:FAD-dependent oxidoreductase [Gammaproteobacteria bacterium]